LNKKWWSKVIWVVSLILMGVTAVFTLMGGIGTTCVAFNPTGFGGSFAGIAPFQWLYILFVVITTAFGVMGIRAVILIIRKTPDAYRYAVITLIGGTAVSVVHQLISRSLRGSSMPVDMVTGLNLITLAIFLIFYYPGFWMKLGDASYDATNPAGIGGGLSAISIGSVCLTIQYWMGSTHTIAGVNYADIWHTQVQVIGWLLLAVGLVAITSGMGVFSHDGERTRVSPTITD
jgi:hypothetical protein